MTSTEFQLGVDDGAKPSSRVLQPPGGGSSNIFAFGNESTSQAAANTQAAAKSRHNANKSNIFDPPENSTATGTPTKKPDASQNRIFGEPPPQAAKSVNVKGQGTHNPITGLPYATSTAGGEPEKPSIKLKQPPGGASSGLW